MTAQQGAGERAGLLRLELETLWVLDREGRIVRSTSPDVPYEPLLVVAAHPGAPVWAASAQVPATLMDGLAAAVADAAPIDDVGWQPSTAAEILAILRTAGLGALAPAMGGPSWRIPATMRRRRTGAELCTSHDLALDALQGRMPEQDRRLTEPWVVAMVAGEVAAVCETARSTAHGVEAGVWTYEPHRRQGLAVAVTAAWSELVTDRTAFYSTSWDNDASQAVARRLDLEPLGHWWQVFRREPVG